MTHWDCWETHLYQSLCCSKVPSLCRPSSSLLDEPLNDLTLLSQIYLGGFLDPPTPIPPLQNWHRFLGEVARRTASLSTARWNDFSASDLGARKSAAGSGAQSRRSPFLPKPWDLQAQKAWHHGPRGLRSPFGTAGVQQGSTLYHGSFASVDLMIADAVFCHWGVFPLRCIESACRWGTAQEGSVHFSQVLGEGPSTLRDVTLFPHRRARVCLNEGYFPHTQDLPDDTLLQQIRLKTSWGS